MKSINLYCTNINSFIVQSFINEMLSHGTQVLVYKIENESSRQKMNAKNKSIIFYDGSFDIIPFYESFFKDELLGVLIIDFFGTSVNNIKKIIQNKNVGIVAVDVKIDEILNYLDNINQDNFILCNTIQEHLIKFLFIDNIYIDSNFNDVENRIIDAAKQGLTIQETADLLLMSKNTIAAYRSKLLKKTNVKTMNQLIADMNKK